jgi:sugar phosphate isomerase/epimerase
MNGPFTLAYPVSTVDWDGKTINKLPAADISRALDLMQGCGIDRVMLSGYHLAEPSAFDVDAETKRIGAELAARGMRAAQHHGLSATYAPVGSPQDESVGHLRRCVDFTANLGAEALVLHPGRATGHFATVQAFIDVFQKECEAHGKERVMECCAENLRVAGRHAQARGVKIAIENVDRFEPLGNRADLPKLVDMAGSPAVGYCLDSGHAHCAGCDVVGWIDLMGDRLFTTHFHDNHGPGKAARAGAGMLSPAGIDEHLPPGFGTIPWTDVVAALRRIGYSHPVNFESGAWPGMEPAEGLKAAIRYWRTCEYLAGQKPR